MAAPRGIELLHGVASGFLNHGIPRPMPPFTTDFRHVRHGIGAKSFPQPKTESIAVVVSPLPVKPRLVDSGGPLVEAQHSLLGHSHSQECVATGSPVVCTGLVRPVFRASLCPPEWCVRTNSHIKTHIGVQGWARRKSPALYPLLVLSQAPHLKACCPLRPRKVSLQAHNVCKLMHKDIGQKLSATALTEDWAPSSCETGPVILGNRKTIALPARVLVVHHNVDFFLEIVIKLFADFWVGVFRNSGELARRELSGKPVFVIGRTRRFRPVNQKVLGLKGLPPNIRVVVIVAAARQGRTKGKRKRRYHRITSRPDHCTPGWGESSSRPRCANGRVSPPARSMVAPASMLQCSVASRAICARPSTHVPLEC